MMHFNLNQSVKCLVSLLFCSVMLCSIYALGQNNVEEENSLNIQYQMSLFPNIFSGHSTMREDGPIYSKCTTTVLDEQLFCTRLHDVGIEELVGIPFVVNFDDQSMNILLVRPQWYQFINPNTSGGYRRDGMINSLFIGEGVVSVTFSRDAITRVYIMINMLMQTYFNVPDEFIWHQITRGNLDYRRAFYSGNTFIRLLSLLEYNDDFGKNELTMVTIPRQEDTLYKDLLITIEQNENYSIRGEVLRKYPKVKGLHFRGLYDYNGRWWDLIIYDDLFSVESTSYLPDTVSLSSIFTQIAEIFGVADNY